MDRPPELEELARLVLALIRGALELEAVASLGSCELEDLEPLLEHLERGSAGELAELLELELAMAEGLVLALESIGGAVVVGELGRPAELEELAGVLLELEVLAGVPLEHELAARAVADTYTLEELLAEQHRRRRARAPGPRRRRRR